MPSLPRFQLSGEPHGETSGQSQSALNPSLPAASWSGYPTQKDDELIGKRLNETYTVESVIGEGGMGRVYRASHTRISSKLFAVKVLRPEFTRNAEVVTRFRREAEAAASITHPNVVEVYDVDETTDGYSYLVSEYLAGQDLSEYLADQGRLDSLLAVNISLQLCRALEAAHDAGVVHRDIKPHNVFLIAGENGKLPAYPAVKILDFGLSRFMDCEGTQLTRAGVIMGTPAYMSPEQAEGKAVDARTDVYGVGAVLFAMLTGRPPYEADTLQALVLAVISQEPDRPRSINTEIPENLEFIVQRAMARTKQDRYQSMAELRAALENFYERSMTESRGAISQPRAISSSGVQEPGAENLATARPRLLAYGAALMLLAAFGLSSSLSSIELWTGPVRLSKLEALLLVFGVFGTLLTPASLLLRRLRKTIWNNHGKVLAELQRVRYALFVAILSYGIATLSLHFLNDVVSRFAPSRLLGQLSGAGFRGFNLVLFLIGASWSILSIARHWGERRPQSRALNIALITGALLLSGGLCYAGLRWRAHAEVAQPQAIDLDPLTEAPENTPGVSNEDPSEEPAPAEPKNVERATTDELAAANSKGIAGLLPLAERYPEDPEVLRPLFYAFAARATGLADAMTVAVRLLKVSPEDAKESDLRFLVKKGAASPGEASRIAFDLMTEKMGTTGPDLLYELYLSEPKVSHRAEQLLRDPKVIAHTTPALAIAMDLRRANTCTGRLPLLERAAALGDRRSVAILSPLTIGSKTGCGRWKRSPCPPACAEESRAYYQTITKILERQPSAR